MLCLTLGPRSLGWCRCFAEGKKRRKRRGEFPFIRNQAKTCKVCAYVLIDRKVSLRARGRICLRSLCVKLSGLSVGVSGPDFTFTAGTRNALTHTNTDDYFHVKADNGRVLYNL